MKTLFGNTWLRSGFCSAGLAVAVAFTPASASASIITLSPATQNVGVGGSFDVAVRISGIGNHTAPSVGAFDFDLSFDSALVHFNSITFGDPSLGDLLGPVVGTASGSSLSLAGDSLNLFSVSLDSSGDLSTAQPDQFTLASVHFTALGLGSGAFNLAINALGDADGAGLAVDPIQSASVNITAQPVPEADTWWAAALGFGVLAFSRHQMIRRQSRSKAVIN